MQDYQKLFLSSVVLGTKELNIGYNNAMSWYLIEKVTYQVLMEIISATIDFKLFAFQIRATNAEWFLYIILHLAPLLTYLSTSVSASDA